MSIREMLRLSVVFVVASMASVAGAQQQPAAGASSLPDGGSSSSTSTPAQKIDRGTEPKELATPVPAGNQQSTAGKVTGTSNDRLFFALPNFLTLENAGQVPPLTSGQKFDVVFRSAFDPIQFAWYGFLSSVSQAENSEPGFRQGWEGYAKRYGAAFADGTIENFMVGAVFPSLLHQDPRYFQLGHGSFVHRTTYAISRSFVTRGDSGKEQFNASEIFGGMLSAAISTNTYHPTSFTTLHYSASGQPVYVFTPSDRTLGNTASVWGTQLGYDTLTLVVKEFWPDVHRRLVKHKKNATAAGQ